MIKHLARLYVKTALPLVVLLTAPFAVQGSGFQINSLSERIYRAYITGDMHTWEALLRELPANSPEPELYEMAMAHYGFIGYCLGREEKSRARPYLDRVEEMTRLLLIINPDNPRYLALQGALYGFRMGYQPQKIMVIGPKSLKVINLALEMGPDSPEAWIESGNKDWHMPAAFGGSKERAISSYEKAIRLMEADPAFNRKDWYYLNIQMILAEWYASRNLTFLAQEIYRKLLSIEPAFQWAGEKIIR
ncbi:MAG: hypothetical protein R6V75_04115 [Bacteroidales bacterium]